VHDAPQVHDVQHGGPVHGEQWVHDGQVQRGAPDAGFGVRHRCHGAPSHEMLSVHHDDWHVDDCYALHQAGALRVHGVHHDDVHHGAPRDQDLLLLCQESMLVQVMCS